MTEETFREARTLLLERKPENLGRGLPLGSIRDATWVHQRHAIVNGYNSLLELAIDELAAEINECKRRMDALEAQLDAGG